MQAKDSFPWLKLTTQLGRDSLNNPISQDQMSSSMPLKVSSTISFKVSTFLKKFYFYFWTLWLAK